MNTSVATRTTQISPVANFSQRQVEILKNSICRGVSADEFEIFLMACVKTQLDPFMRQIYAVKRGDSMTIQTGIDGYRLIAERTDRYAPGPEPTFVLDDKGKLASATAYIKKQTKDGTWHEVSASASMDEYCPMRNGRPSGMWDKMPKTMLAKCAEAQALRKAFPAEMSGIYTKEEMMQADVEDTIVPITQEQVFELEDLLVQCDEAYQKLVAEHLKKKYKTDQLLGLPLDVYTKLKAAALKKIDEKHNEIVVKEAA